MFEVQAVCWPEGLIQVTVKSATYGYKLPVSYTNFGSSLCIPARSALGRPPVVAGVGFDPPSIPRQPLTASHQHGLELIQIGKRPVGHWLIYQRPESLGRLELGGGGREEDQIDALGHDQGAGGVPARAVEHEHRPVQGVDPVVLGEGGERGGHRRRADRRQQAPPALPRGRPDEGVDIHPVVAAMDPGRGSVAAPGPDPADHWQQAKPVLVFSPNGEPGGGMGSPYRIDVGLEPPFLKAAWATGSACVARGRGRWGVKPIDRIASQPRGSPTGRPNRSAIQAATLPQVQSPPSGAAPASAA